MKVYLVGKQVLVQDEVERFLKDEQREWRRDSYGPNSLAEMAGRLCYMSYGKGRKSNKEFLEHIVEVGHDSVLEHAVWNFVVTGVSRSLSHELVRHRHFSFSQLSQRYVDESNNPLVEPDAIRDNDGARKFWMGAVAKAKESYGEIVQALELAFASEPDPTLRRKAARQAARSVLPNATETKVFLTANARALRHFFLVRGTEFAEPEIRQLALAMLDIVSREAPAMFGDLEVHDGMISKRRQCCGTCCAS